MLFIPLCLVLIIHIDLAELLSRPGCTLNLGWSFSVIAPKLSPNHEAPFKLFRETSITSPRHK